MNRIVRTHYPVERLPEDLRLDLPEGSTVTVTLQEEQSANSSSNVSLMIEEMKAIRERMPLTKDDPVKRIRKLRNEWDD